MKKIEMLIECPACRGTGVYSGVAETEETAVICNKCEGTGAYNYVYEYELFTKRKIKDKIKRVYKNSYGYKLGLGKVNFKTPQSVTGIDMDKEGVSYEEFLQGAMPQHIEALVCPLLADQSACHKIPGFVDRCDKLNKGWLNYIPDCKNRCNMKECWELFKLGRTKCTKN